MLRLFFESLDSCSSGGDPYTFPSWLLILNFEFLGGYRAMWIFYSIIFSHADNKFLDILLATKLVTWLLQYFLELFS